MHMIVLTRETWRPPVCAMGFECLVWAVAEALAAAAKDLGMGYQYT
jgi:hypothetical protein